MILRKKGVRFLIFTFFLLCTTSAFSLEKDSLGFGWNPTLNLKFSPLALLDFAPAVQFATEFKGFERHSINFEYGYIFGIQGEDFSGHKFRLGYRFYLDPKRDNGPFLGLQVMNKNVNLNTSGFAWSPDRTFQRIYDFKINNHTQAYYVTSGYTFNINDRWTFEFMYGLGRRILNVASKDLPEGVEPNITLNESFFTNFNLGISRTPAMLANFKFGYVLFGQR